MMNELSELLKIDSRGRLVTLEIRKENGTVVIPSKVDEEAINYLRIFDYVNKSCQEFWKNNQQKSNPEIDVESSRN